MNDKLRQVKQLLESCTSSQRREILAMLRKEFPIHPIEKDLNIKAEIILEAFAKDQSGLTFRMMRGVIAQTVFKLEIVNKLNGWQDKTPPGDLPYDFLLIDSIGSVSIQLKLQRSTKSRPTFANEVHKRRKFSQNMYIVETQRTRGGKDKKTNKSTRPYKFGEFDILAVAMQPSTKDWSKFMYTIGRWLIPDEKDPENLSIYQPVSMTPNEDWTDDFKTCITWFRSNESKTISSN